MRQKCDNADVQCLINYYSEVSGGTLPWPKLQCYQVWIQDLTKGANHGERRARDYNESGQTGIWRQSTKWDAGKELSVGSGAKPTKPFVYFHTKETPKVDDLTDSSSSFSRPIASRSNDQSLLLVNDGGCP